MRLFSVSFFLEELGFDASQFLGLRRDFVWFSGFTLAFAFVVVESLAVAFLGKLDVFVLWLRKNLPSLC